MRSLRLTLRTLSFALLLAGAVQAQAPAEGAQPSVAVTVDSTSPRASVLGYLNAARAGDYARAANWLDQSDAEVARRSTEIARRLKAVLDTHLWVEIDKVSPLAHGDTTDGLPRDRESLGSVKLLDGREVPIRLARVNDGVSSRWVFSNATVVQVDLMYGQLPDNWIREHLPDQLLRTGPFEVLYWQWIALFILIPASALIGWTLMPPTRGLLRKISARTRTEFDDKLIAAAGGPILLLWSLAASRVLLRWIALATPAQTFVVEVQAAIATIAVYWVILRAIAVLQETIPVSVWGSRHPALRSLIPLGGRIARVLVFVIATLTVVAQFGYPVATILAGLGIGGIAVALGAQKSLEHFFGSVSIGVDQPFRVGDWVNVGGLEGEVEAIGLRSTRIRTAERTVVSIPNGKLAESQTENFAPRERIRLRTVIGLEYGTTAAQMRAIRDEIEQCLRAHPLTWPNRVLVRFCEFGASSLNIELFCWIQTSKIDEFRAVREQLFLEMMEIVERNGSSFAFPTQTIHLVGDEPKLG